MWYNKKLNISNRPATGFATAHFGDISVSLYSRARARWRVRTRPGRRGPTRAKGVHGMSTSFMLQGKRAVVFGGAGSIGAAVAKAFASEGAEVFLAGRTATSVLAVAKEIKAAGGWAHAAVIDTLDGAAVEAYLESVVGQTGGLDIEFNATGPRARVRQRQAGRGRASR